MTENFKTGLIFVLIAICLSLFYLFATYFTDMQRVNERLYNLEQTKSDKIFR